MLNRYLLVKFNTATTFLSILPLFDFIEHKTWLPDGFLVTLDVAQVLNGNLVFKHRVSNEEIHWTNKNNIRIFVEWHKMWPAKSPCILLTMSTIPRFLTPHIKHYFKYIWPQISILWNFWYGMDWVNVMSLCSKFSSRIKHSNES